MTSRLPRRSFLARPSLRVRFYGGIGVEILHVQGTTHIFATHAHPSCTVTLIEQGCVNVTLAGLTIPCTAGAVILINAWERHGARAPDGQSWTYTACSLSVTALTTAALQTDLPSETQGVQSAPGLHSQVVYDADLFAAFQMFHHQPSDLQILDTLGLLLKRYGHFARDEATASRPVQAIRELFQAYPDTSIGLRDLADALGVSVSHLVRSFHTQVGYSPHEYLLLWRSEHARQQLRTGESLAQTALLCGYYDQSHLTGQFKRTFGITPARYAAALHALPISSA